MTETQQIEIPRGHVVITTYGPVTAETMVSYGDMRVRAHSLGLNNVVWNVVHGHLVDKARNEAVQQMLADPQAKWLWFIDADMSFKPDLIDKMLSTAFSMCPWADIVGGWCPLRGEPYLPTIDTGTGTWEPIAPHDGPKEVIRTGAACVLVKRHVYEKMQPPWYGVRPAPRPLDMLYEFDNYCNIKFDGKNPFLKYSEWNKLLQCATDEGGQANGYTTVGEDSSFCDRAKALGFRIVVQTDAVCNHIDRRTITPEDHLNAMKERRKRIRAAAGIME